MAALDIKPRGELAVAHGEHAVELQWDTPWHGTCRTRPRLPWVLRASGFFSF